MIALEDPSQDVSYASGIRFMAKLSTRMMWLTGDLSAVVDALQLDSLPRDVLLELSNKFFNCDVKNCVCGWFLQLRSDRNTTPAAPRSLAS